MAFAAKEVFYTCRGEGRNAGPRRRLLSLRRSCNLWSGREADQREHRLQLLPMPTSSVPTASAAGRFATASDLAQAIAAT